MGSTITKPRRKTGAGQEKQEMAPLVSIVDKYKKEKGAIIPIMQKAQDAYGYLSQETMEYIAKEMGTTLANIYGIATFYTQFRLQPIGKHLVRVCHGTACHVGGAEDINHTVCGHLDVESGETSSDRLFTVQKVVCVGACSLAPIMIVDDSTYGRLNPDKARKVIIKYQKEEAGNSGK